MGKVLIVYYSLANGNTKKIAMQIAEVTGADIAEIQTVHAYEGSYDDIVEQGKREVDCGYMPLLRPLSVAPEDYDVIIIGTPTWWFTMAPAIASFLWNHNWAGKKVILFQTHGGWPGHTIKDMENACKGAEFMCEGKIQFDSAGGSRMITSSKEINNWIEKIKGAIR